MTKWTRDLKLEQFLKKLHVKFDWEVGYKVSDIDFAESLNRQTRVGKKIDEILVNSYGVQMLDGAAFPGILINQPSKSFSYILSGLHRGHAVKDIHETTVDCYIVRLTDTRLLDIVPRVVNALEGRRPDRDELLANALFLVDKLGLEPKDVCAWYGLKPDHITTAKRQHEVAQAMREEGVNPEGMVKSLFTQLSPLAGNRNVLKSAGKLAKELPFVEALKMIATVKEYKTEGEQLSAVRQWRKDFEEIKADPLAKVVRTTKRSKFLTAFKSLERILKEVESSANLQLSDRDREVVAQGWQIIHTKMTALMREPAGARR